MKVAVIGCGYVGLVSAVGFARAGHHVVAIETAEPRLKQLRRGKPPFFEPGLEKLLPQMLRRGRVRFSNRIEGVRGAEIVLICVGTPSGRDGAIDLRHLRKAVRGVARVLRHPLGRPTVVIRSTVVPGTTEQIVLPLLRRGNRKGRLSVGLAVNPEFLREGMALADFQNPDRIVIGELDSESGDAVCRLYRSFKAPILRTTMASAETIKYASNALLATLISFSNEFAHIAEALPGVDVEEVLKGVHLDRRLSPVVPGRRFSPPILEYLRAGCGYGGSCLPKDVKALIAFARKRGLRAEVLKAVNAVNTRQPAHLIDLAERAAGGLKKKRVLLLGLSFKAGTDDVRESPGLMIAEELLRRQARLLLYDPLVKPRQVAQLLHAGAAFVEDPKAVMNGVDVCIITTRAPEFSFVETYLNKGGTARPIVVDGRRLIANRRLTSSGRFVAVGLNRSGRLGKGR